MKEFEYNHKKIILGTNAINNTSIIIDTQKQHLPYVFWFHLKDFPSPHLLFFNDSNKILKNELIHCCTIIKNHSKYYNYRSLDFIYCNLKFVMTTSTPGLVQTSRPVFTFSF